MSLLRDAWTAFNEPLVGGWARVGQHVEMSLIALSVAGLIGLLLGIVCWRLGPVAAAIAIGVGNLGRTLPTFAVMALVLALTKVGLLPAIVGLVILGIPPVLLNVYTGLRTNDESVTQAARGMGLTSTQTLTRVELPLALPFIFTGLKSAAVQIVATAALAGAIGAGGLGNMIQAGLSTDRNDLILAGTIPVIGLSILVEAALSLLARFTTPTGLRIQRRASTIQGRMA